VSLRFERCIFQGVKKRLRPLLVLAALIAVSNRVAAQEPSGRVEVDRDDAARIASQRGPGVALAESPRAAIAETGHSAYALPRAPTATVSAGYRGGSFTPGPEIVVTVMQDVSLRSLGGARSAVADALHEVVETDVARARLESATRGALAWVGACEAREIFRLRSEGLAQAQALADTTRKRVDAGAALPYERALAEAELGAARASVLDAEGVEVEALAELRFALGMSPADTVAVRGDLYASDAIAEDARAPIDGGAPHPAVDLARARARAATEETRLASATLGPTMGFGASYVREGTGNQVALGIVSFPIPFLDPARFESSRQHAAAIVASAQVDRTRAELARDRAVAAHEREHWREVRDALRTGTLAPTEEALRLVRAQYEAGSRDVTVVLIARQRLAATRESLAHAAAEVQRADIRFARAVGTLKYGGN
jgi:outer membrane protein TolC